MSGESLDGRVRQGAHLLASAVGGPRVVHSPSTGVAGCESDFPLNRLFLVIVSRAVDVTPEFRDRSPCPTRDLRPCVMA